MSINMLFFSPLICSLSLFALTYSLTIPADLLLPRSQHCANAPATIAGSMLSRRSSSIISASKLGPRMDPEPSTAVWCIQGTRTFIVVTMINVLGGRTASQSVQSLLTGCMNIISYEIERNHDGPIDGGHFDREISSSGLIFQVWSANNHQITYGVLGAAVKALADYMHWHGWGACIFSLYDGPTQVGIGQIDFR